MFKSLVSQALLLLCLVSSVYSADIDLQPLLASGGTVTLNPANTYYVSNEFSVPADTTIIGNGATITVYNGPVKGNSRCLTLEDCNITGSGAWACVAFQNGGSGEIHGCTISCAGANAVYVADSSLKLYNTIIKDSQYGVNSVRTSSLELTNCSFRNCQMSYLQQKGTSTWINGVVEQSGGTAVNFLDSVTVSMTGTRFTMSEKDSIAVQFLKTSTGDIHGITVEGVSHGILIDSGRVTLDSSNLSSPFKFQDGAGAGIASLRGAALTIRDCSFTGFENAVQVNEYAPPGTANVERCVFTNTEVSALSAVGASNVRFYDNLCQDTKQDSVYLKQSTGIVERNRIFRSLNTGVSFLSCTGGCIMRQNHVEGCFHQGVGVVHKSQQIIVEQNTFVTNTVANIYIDKTSGATISGNILYGTPDADVRFHGTQGILTISNLVIASQQGFEVSEGATLTFRLNRIADNLKEGILNNSSSVITLYCSDFQNNGKFMDSYYSIFNNTGGVISGEGNSFGPPGSRGLYNNAGNTLTFTNNYWGASDGPEHGSSGSGAIVNWNTSNGSSVMFTPFATQPTLASDHSINISLLPDEETIWNADFGTVSLTFNAKASAPEMHHQFCGAMHCYATELLTSEGQFPTDYLPGHLFVVWNSFFLAYYGSSITVTFHYDPSGYSGGLQLYRQEDSGAYLPVSSTQNVPAQTITYTPADPFNAQGTFILVKSRFAPQGFYTY